MQGKANRHTLAQLFFSMLYISAFTFGGGFVIITFMKRKFVDGLHWIDDQEMLDLAGIESDTYGDFLREFRNEIPALTFSGYFDSEGEAHSHLETNAFDEKIEEYQIVQYHRMFGRE